MLAMSEDELTAYKLVIERETAKAKRGAREREAQKAAREKKLDEFYEKNEAAVIDYTTSKTISMSPNAAEVLVTMYFGLGKIKIKLLDSSTV
jgi:hypothetical protein